MNGAVNHAVNSATSSSQARWLGKSFVLKVQITNVTPYLPICAVFKPVADLVLGLEEIVFEGRGSSPSDGQLIVQITHTAHMHIGWRICRHWMEEEEGKKWRLCHGAVGMFILLKWLLVCVEELWVDQDENDVNQMLWASHFIATSQANQTLMGAFKSAELRQQCSRPPWIKNTNGRKEYNLGKWCTSFQRLHQVKVLELPCTGLNLCSFENHDSMNSYHIHTSFWDLLLDCTQDDADNIMLKQTLKKPSIV